MLALRVLVHAQVVSSLFYKSHMNMLFRLQLHMTLLLLLVWEITKQDKASVGNP